MSRMSTTRSYEIEFCIMEHGLMGTHQDLEYLEKSIIRKVRMQNADCHRMMRRDQHNSNENVQRNSRFPGGYGQRQIVMLNHSGNDKRKAFPGIATCADRLTTYVLDAVQQSVREHQVLAAQRERAKNPFALPKPPISLSCSSADPETRKNCSLSREDGDNCSSLTKPPFPSSSLCTEPSSSRPQWKLVFHVIGYSLGGLVIRAALPSIMRSIEERYIKGSDESFYAVEWRSFFSLCSPNVGSDSNHPMMNSSYRLAGCLSCFCLLPEVIEDLLLKTDYVENVLLSPMSLKAIKRFANKVFITLTNDRMVWNYSAGFYLPPIERRILDGWKPKDPVFNPRAIPCRLRGAGNGGERRENTPWLLYDDEELCMLHHQQEYLQSMGIHPGASTEELLHNGVVVQQQATKEGPSQSIRGRAPHGETISDSYSSSLSIDTEGSANWITEHSWPINYLSKERIMAKAFLEGVGPVELHVADLDKMIANYLDEAVALCDHQSCPDSKLVWGLMETTLKGAHQLVLFSAENQRDGRRRRSRSGVERRSSCPTASSLRDDELADEEEEEDYMNERNQSPFSFILEFIVHRIVFSSRNEEDSPTTPPGSGATSRGSSAERSFQNVRVRGTVADVMRSAGNSFTKPPSEAHGPVDPNSSHSNNPNRSNVEAHSKGTQHDPERSIAEHSVSLVKSPRAGICNVTTPVKIEPGSPDSTPSSPPRPPNSAHQHRLSGEDNRQVTFEDRIFPSFSTETDYTGIPSSSSRGGIGVGGAGADDACLPEHGEGFFSCPFPLPRSPCPLGMELSSSSPEGGDNHAAAPQEDTPPSSFSSSLLSSRAATDWMAAETEAPTTSSQFQHPPPDYSW